jgi:hypothetical protein
MLSFYAAAGCILMSIPPILIGAIARVTDWSQTDFLLNRKIFKKFQSFQKTFNISEQIRQ